MGSSASIFKKNHIPHWWESPEMQTTLTNSVSFAKIEEWSTGTSVSDVLDDSEYKYGFMWSLKAEDIELKMKREVSRGDRYLMQALQSYINSYKKDDPILLMSTRKATLKSANTFSMECEVKTRFVKTLKDLFPLPSEHNLLKKLRLIIRGEMKIGTGESSDLYKSGIDFKFDIDKVVNNKYKRSLYAFAWDVVVVKNSSELKTQVPFKVIKNLCPDEIILNLDVMLEWSSNEESIYLPVPVKSRDFLQLQLLWNGASEDFTIVADNGAEVKCHKFVLSSSSPVFEAMLSPSNGMKELQEGKMTMPGRSEAAVINLIRFLYEQEITYLDLKCDLALELLQIGHMYELEQLWKAIYNLLLQKPRNWFSTDAIIELYYFVRNLGHCETLKNQLLQMMMGMTAEELRSCEQVQKLEPAELADLMAMMYDKLRK